MRDNQEEGILCLRCGGTKKPGFTTFTADVKGIVAEIRQMPVTIFSLCGNEWLSDPVAEQIESIVQDAGEKNPSV